MHKQEDGTARLCAGQVLHIASLSANIVGCQAQARGSYNQVVVVWSSRQLAFRTVDGTSGSGATRLGLAGRAEEH